MINQETNQIERNKPKLKKPNKKPAKKPPVKEVRHSFENILLNMENDGKSQEKEPVKSSLSIIRKIEELTAADFSWSISEKSIKIKVNGPLLSTNVLISLMSNQKNKSLLKKYKKAMMDKFSDIFDDINSKKHNQLALGDNVKLKGVRMSPGMLDLDALSMPFKFVIDLLVKSRIDGAPIIQDDNPGIIRTMSFSQKRTPDYGFMVQLSTHVCNHMDEDQAVLHISSHMEN